MSANPSLLIVRLNDTVIRTIALDMPVLTIGRAADNALSLPHRLISRHHAEIRTGGDAAVVVDLGSANGISVEGEPLPARSVFPLVRGAVVQIGPYTLTYQTPDDAEVPATAMTDEETLVTFR